MEKKNSIMKGRGIYIIPNLFTLGNLFSGFFSIIFSLDGRYEMAAYSIVIAAFFDGMDGRVARLTHTNSRFGLEFDSLADVVSFGVSPALMIYLYALRQYGRIGWMVAFLFVAGGALRLARFNVMADKKEEKKFFTGLPIPAAALTVVSYILIALFYNWSDTWKGHKIILPFMVILISFLMVSNQKYIGFKELDLKKKKPFSILVIAVVSIYIIALNPRIFLFLFAMLYLLSGFLYFVLFPEQSASKLKEKTEVKEKLESKEILGK